MFKSSKTLVAAEFVLYSMAVNVLAIAGSDFIGHDSLLVTNI